MAHSISFCNRNDYPDFETFQNESVLHGNVNSDEQYCCTSALNSLKKLFAGSCFVRRTERVYSEVLEEKETERERSASPARRISKMVLQSISECSLIPRRRSACIVPDNIAIVSTPMSMNSNSKEVNFHKLSLNKDDLEAAHQFAEKCFMPEVTKFLCAVLGYRKCCESHRSKQKQYKSFVRIIESYVRVGSPLEINICEQMRQRLLLLVVGQDEFFVLLPHTDDRLNVFEEPYKEIESLFWTNINSRYHWPTTPLAT